MRLDGLRWAEKVGGLDALVTRSGRKPRRDRGVGEESRLDRIPRGRQAHSLVHVGVFEDRHRRHHAFHADAQAAIPKKITALLEKEQVAYDIDAYRDAPAGFRLWGGATVEQRTSPSALSLARLGLRESLTI